MVAVIIPPITAVPMAIRPLAPGPVATASGNTPKMNAKLVIRIGRRRIRAASMAASMTRLPSFSARSANSFIRIAFFDVRPIVVSKPIWRNTSFSRPRRVTNRIAPTKPKGTTSRTAKGMDQLS